MYASSSTPSVAQLFQDLLGDFHSRRLLFHTSLNQSPDSANPPASTNNPNSTESYLGDGNFDANVVMVLSVLLCALICSLGLNSIIRCALRCSNFVANESGTGSDPPARLANTGIKKKALKTFPTLSYLPELKLPGLDTECVICLSDFTNGDRVRILPKCNHGFHVRCIDKWLNSHSSCPKCRQCLIETCQKIVGCGQATSTQPPAQPVPVPETIVRIVPLEPEARVSNYREVS
ncbi:hypothetical protein L6164_012280 [Bauhinia variegata]|uniref:Uncharacterized protein n=1 Tax=Bauhinia variegata TaxID=167791 RepID=A0ACB9P9K7_BAUVA|nr:hypothetical protein L6164_012280 [Bauhinia variegata]